MPQELISNMCEGKHLCPNKIEVSMRDLRVHSARQRPILCPDCMKIFGGDTFDEIDAKDPWPNGCGRNPY